MCKSKFLVWLLVLGQVIGLVAQSVAMAQSAVPTDKIPNIEHEFISESAISPYTFKAKVSDDSKITSVIFLYRYNDAVEFQRLSMLLEKDDSTYSVSIPDAQRRDGTIQYYFIAFDDRGNAKVSNFQFDPFSRVVSLDWQPIGADESGQPEIAQNESIQTETASTSEPTSRKIKPLHILFGVLAVGAVAALAGSGDKPSSGNGCASAGCSVTLVLPPPTPSN